MIFDEWFEAKFPQGSIQPEVIREAFREIAWSAWSQGDLEHPKNHFIVRFWTLFDDKGKRLIREMMEDKDMSPTGIIKMAIRHLQYTHAMAKEGYTEVLYAKPTGEIYTKPSKLSPDLEG